MSISRFLDVRVFNDVTVQVNETEEVETKRRSQSTQHPTEQHSNTSQVILLLLKQPLSYLVSFH